MVYFAWLPGDYHLAWVVAGLVVHGLGAGLSLAALHRAALGQVAPEQMGIAAGLYSMNRFTGSSLGPALSGVLVQQALNRGLMPIAAYHTVFIVIAVVAGLGMLLMAKGLDE
jgi:MFS family permease